MEETELRTSFIDEGNRIKDKFYLEETELRSVLLLEETELRTSFIDGGNRIEDKFYCWRKQN